MKNFKFEKGEYFIVDRYSETFTVCDAGNELALQSHIENFVQNLRDEGMLSELCEADITVFGPIKATRACLKNQDVPAREITVTEVVPTKPRIDIHWPGGVKQS